MPHFPLLALIGLAAGKAAATGHVVAGAAGAGKVLAAGVGGGKAAATTKAVAWAAKCEMSLQPAKIVCSFSAGASGLISRWCRCCCSHGGRSGSNCDGSDDGKHSGARTAHSANNVGTSVERR